MDNISYVCSEADAHAMRFEIPLISVKATAFSAEVPALISSHRRLLCMNMKQTNRLRVLNRVGKYADTDVRAPVLRHLVSSEGLLDHCAFFAAGGEDVVRLRPLSQASGELSVVVNSLALGEEMYGVAVGFGDIVYALGKWHIYEVNMETTVKLAEFELPQKTVVKYPTIAYHQAAQLLLTPARRNCLDLVNSATRRSVLPKVWEPHSGDVPTAAFFFQRRELTNEAADSVLIVTAARSNSELRFWSYNKTTRNFSLMQDVNISFANAEASAPGTEGEDDDSNGFLISCTPNEEYITLTSKKHPLAVVLEIHRNSFKVHRITSWRLQGPVLCSVATVGKVAESISSTSIEYQLILTVRTPSGFFEEVLDVEKLTGASNTAGMKRGSVLQWFPQSDNAAGGANGAVGGADNAVPSTHLPASLTSVSSSVSGDKTNAVSQAAVVKIVRQQSAQFCQTLRGIDEHVVGLQKRASEVMRLFQEARARDEAQTVGRKFAMRNKGRIEQQQQQQPSSRGAEVAGDQLSAAQEDLVQRIRVVVDAVEAGAAESAVDVLKKLLPRRLKEAVEKGAKEAEQMDPGQATLNIRGTESARVFNNKVDAAVRLAVRAVKEQHALMQTAASASLTASANAVRRADDFMEAVKKEMALVQTDLRETREALSQSQTAAPMDPDALVAQAVTLAESGEWRSALTMVLEAGDVRTLLAFLGSRVCEESMATIAGPQIISLPNFLSVCVQLSFELASESALVPLRIRLLQVFYVEWDDTLKDMKQKAATDGKQKSLFEFAKRELLSVAEQLGNIEDSTVDRKSRNSLRLLRRLLVSILED